MDRLAKRVLTEQVKPKLEKMLDSDITMKEFEYIKDCIRLAKELMECDVLSGKLDEARGNPKPADMIK